MQKELTISYDLSQEILKELQHYKTSHIIYETLFVEENLTKFFERFKDVLNLELTPKRIYCEIPNGRISKKDVTILLEDSEKPSEKYTLKYQESIKYEDYAEDRLYG